MMHWATTSAGTSTIIKPSLPRNRVFRQHDPTGGPGFRLLKEASVDKVNLSQKFALLSEQWSPKVVGELNGQQCKIAKIQGEFVWHHHEAEDELFLVIEGQVTIHLPDRDVVLDQGELLIVPRGVEHKPEAQEEAQILMFEPVGTLNTGNVVDERTVRQVERI